MTAFFLIVRIDHNLYNSSLNPGRASLVAQLVTNAMQETRFQSLGGEAPLEEGMAAHSILTLKLALIPFTSMLSFYLILLTQSCLFFRVHLTFF